MNSYDIDKYIKGLEQSREGLLKRVDQLTADNRDLITGIIVEMHDEFTKEYKKGTSQWHEAIEDAALNVSRKYGIKMDRWS